MPAYDNDKEEGKRKAYASGYADSSAMSHAFAAIF